MKFIIMVWLALLARVKPVSTMAKPACMNITRKPVTKVHTKLMAILFWPTWLTMSPRVIPVVVLETATSLMVPVVSAPGSPLAMSSVLGPARLLRSWSVMATGTGLGAGLAAGASALKLKPRPRAAARTTPRRGAVPPRIFFFTFSRFIIRSSLKGLFFPDGLAEEMHVQHAENPHQADGDADEGDHSAPHHRTAHIQARDRDQPARQNH